jgi:hypothetical protein
MMTVVELKEILMDWPEADSEGEPTEVWIETGYELSSQVSDYSRLGSQEHILLESRAFEKMA